MKGTQEKEMGKMVLSDYLEARKNLKMKQEELSGLQNRTGRTYARNTEYERVRESVRHDQMERQAVECLLLEADIRLLQKRLAQWEAHINRALRQIPRTEARLLQLYYIEEKTWACCAEEVGYSETAGYFRKVKDRAYENFWLAYQGGVSSGLMEKARECQLWKESLRQQRQKKLITCIEEEKMLTEKTGMSMRQLRRVLRLLELTPGLQRAVGAGKCGLMPAYHLSFLRKDEQILLCGLLPCSPPYIRTKQAAALRKLSEGGGFHRENILKIINNEMNASYVTGDKQMAGTERKTD